MPRARTSPATPSPVPGPTTTRLAFASARPAPIWTRPSSARVATASACASKSLRTTTSSKPSSDISARGRTTQSQFVSAISSPSTGPATAWMTERGRASVAARTTAWIASSILAKSAVWTIGNAFASPASSASREKRALVPPMSPRRIGKRRASSGMGSAARWRLLRRGISRPPPKTKRETLRKRTFPGARDPAPVAGAEPGVRALRTLGGGSAPARGPASRALAVALPRRSPARSSARVRPGRSPARCRRSAAPTAASADAAGKARRRAAAAEAPRRTTIAGSRRIPRPPGPDPASRRPFRPDRPGGCGNDSGARRSGAPCAARSGRRRPSRRASS